MMVAATRSEPSAPTASEAGHRRRTRSATAAVTTPRTPASTPTPEEPVPVYVCQGSLRRPPSWPAGSATLPRGPCPTATWSAHSAPPGQNLVLEFPGRGRPSPPRGRGSIPTDRRRPLPGVGAGPDELDHLVDAVRHELLLWSAPASLRARRPPRKPTVSERQLY